MKVRRLMDGMAAFQNSAAPNLSTRLLPRPGPWHNMTRCDMSRHESISEPVLLILASLADKPRHGYALIKDIEALSGVRVRLSTGTLYGALRRLLEDAWIERFEQEDTSREKQAYSLTTAGRRQLQLELDRMKQLTRVAGARLRALPAREA